MEHFAQVEPISLTTALLGGLTALGGAVAHLYHAQRKTHEELVKRAEECDDDRRQLWMALVRIDPNAEELKQL
tara:strand:+ start:4049 stop:4267 length:219 start_codon:yes stop_codon:yes gene_type:complete